MRAIINQKRLVMGTCYYPEHWPESLWEEDLDRMLQAGIEVIRIAEFAWSKVEPTEGNFTYDFFDHFLDLAERKGMKVIFCTPTATPPAWLTSRYPQVLNADINGLLYRHGARRHYNYNAPKYLELSARITEKFAAHYASRPCIVGWQLDNELNCELDEFYSESDSTAFRIFVKEKYGTLDALNEAWGTVFWNQTYTDWEEICVPRKVVSNSNNPHLMLDYKRFISASARRFAKMQSDILRKYIKPDDFITTNGMFQNLDNHQMTEESLDFYMYDSYPNFAYCLDTYRADDKGLRDRAWSWNLTEVRSVSPNFGIMEQQSGANGWNTRMEAPTPRPGQLTLWTMQSIAHGADFISYFRWRTATMGTEMYWHGILDYSGRENRRLREVRSVHEKLEKISGVAGGLYEAKVALLQDYDNKWDSQIDAWHRRVDEVSLSGIFNAAQRSSTPIDFVYLRETAAAEELSQYQVIFYPHASIASKERAKVLEEYVAGGGTLVMGCRSGYKDLRGQCVMAHLPGVFAELTGADIPEYSLIAPDAGTVTIDWEGTGIQAAVFTDQLEALPGARLEAVYTSDYYAGAGALVSKEYGKGKAYYFGSAFTEETADVFLEKLGVKSPYAGLISAKDCEIAARVKDGKRYFFVLNYSSHEVTITLHQAMVDLYAAHAEEMDLRTCMSDGQDSRNIGESAGVDSRNIEESAGADSRNIEESTGAEGPKMPAGPERDLVQGQVILPAYGTAVYVTPN